MAVHSPPASAVRKSAPAKPSWIYSTRIHLELYSILLVVTPLVMLRNFLQQAIAKLSLFNFELFGVTVPTMLAVVAAAALLALLWNIRKITLLHVLAAVFVIGMDALAQQITDYYSHHRFYDLQQNWHYIAYGIFSYMMYRDLDPRGMRLSKIMILTFCCTLLYSAFDEAFQKYINTRVFDISDIAKDAYGSVAGMVMIALGGRHGKAVLADRRLRFPRLADYFKHPFATLVLIFSFSLLLLITGSLMSDDPLFLPATLLAVCLFLVFFFLLHVSQYRIPRYTLIGLLLVGLTAQAFSYWRHRDDGITYSRYGLVVYKGIPLPIFDVMIFPDGSFRYVDKKHAFNHRDRWFFLMHKPDILLIGSGTEGKGGNGFATRSIHQFVFNPHTLQGTQVIIMNTADACKTYNRLRKEQKHVLFVLHSTC